MFVRRAVGDFMPAILVSDEAGGAEGGDELAACALNITPKAKCPFTLLREMVLNLWGENPP